MTDLKASHAMSLVERAKNVLLRPRETWPEIEAEPADAAGIYTRYLLVLALVPAVSGFIGRSLVGVGHFGVPLRVPIAAGLAQAAASYVASLVGVFVLALAVDALAPAFGGQKSRIQALKLAAYGSTAALVGGVFNLLPSLAVLGLLAALYSVYLFFTGLPVLMRNRPEKTAAYTAVTVVAAVVAGLVLNTFASLASDRPLAGSAAALRGGKETDGQIEKVWREGGRALHAGWRKDGSHAAPAAPSKNGPVVKLDGSRVRIDGLAARSGQTGPAAARTPMHEPAWQKALGV